MYTLTRAYSSPKHLFSIKLNFFFVIYYNNEESINYVKRSPYAGIYSSLVPRPLPLGKEPGNEASIYGSCDYVMFGYVSCVMCICVTCLHASQG